MAADLRSTLTEWGRDRVRYLRANIQGPREFSMLVGFLMMSIAGTQYMFALYSEYLKEHMKYDQPKVSFISAVGNLGQYTGILGGIFYDHFGPRKTALLAMSELSLGYILIWASLQYYIPSSFVSLAVYSFFVGQGSHATYIASLSTNSKLYASQYRGTVIGILLFAYGLSAVLFTFLYSSCFAPDVATFLLSVALICGSVDLAGAFVLYTRPEGSATASTGSATAVDITGLRLFRTKTFWLLWLVLFVGTGVGLMFINNLGSIIRSLGGEESDRNRLVIMFSLFNASARYLFGFVADRCARWVPRAFWLACAIFLMLGCHAALFFSQAIRSVLIVGPILAFAYGGIFTLIPSLVSLLYGLPHFGQNWGWMVFASGSGGFLFNMASSYIYSAQITDGTAFCIGPECYRPAFLLTSAACLVALFIASAVVWLTWHQVAEYIEEARLRKQRETEEELAPVVSASEAEQVGSSAPTTDDRERLIENGN